MRNARLGLWLALGWSAVSCSSSTAKLDAGPGLPPEDGAVDRQDGALDQADAGGDVLDRPDLAADVPLDLPAERTHGDEVGQGPGEVAGEAGQAPDVVHDAGLVGSMCYWQREGGRYSLPHFTYGLETPDGQAQRPPPGLGSGYDASAAWPINDFEGRIVSASGNRFTVDSCLTATTCAPSLYRFTLCDGGASCDPLAPGLPVGRRVRVVWHMDNDIVFCPGLYFLAVYDGEAGPSQGSLLFIGSGGRNGSEPGSAPNPLVDLPFATKVEQLACGRTGGAPGTYGDYAFVFTPKQGGAALRLATGEAGWLDFATPLGGTQRLRLHCVDAVQPSHTDDYWNWDFWGSAEAAPIALDGGGG